jgi:glycolate oxidase FAD binding subunit
VHGQTVALDPLWAERATLGGIAAVNDSGALRLRYGGLRDLIIGMTMVLADGTIARSGGKVVKNVAGYDMHKLMTGAFGTLGVITEVNFRLHPMELHAETWSVVSEDASALGVVMMKVLDSRMQVSAMQVRRGGIKRGQVRRVADGFALDVRFAGHPDCLASQQEQMRGMAAGLEMTAAEDAVWLEREKIFDRAGEKDGLVLKVTMLPTQVSAVMAKLDVLSTEHECVTQATGIMTAAVYGNALHMPQLIEKLRGEVGAKGGSVVVHRLPEELRGDVDVWGDVSGTLPLMQRVKQELDPKRILNRGRFARGI